MSVENCPQFTLTPVEMAICTDRSRRQNIQFIYYFNYSSLISNVSRQRSTVATIDKHTRRNHHLHNSNYIINSEYLSCNSLYVVLSASVSLSSLCTSHRLSSSEAKTAILVIFTRTLHSGLASCCFLLIT